ncbi:MAG: hypothetical protein ACLFQX_02770 [Candidatus Kapaibacterium sp.]
MKQSLDWLGIFNDSSKRTVIKGADTIGADGGLFHEALHLALEDRPKYSVRAARSVVFAAERYPFLAHPHRGIIIFAMERMKNESLLFTFLKLFTFIELPDSEEEIGHLMKLCFDTMERPVERIAVRVYALETLYRISEIIPEIKNELGLLIVHLAPHSPPAFQSRGSQILKKLRRETGRNFLETF